MPRKIAAGNWKMNATLSAMGEISALDSIAADGGPEVLICPPFPYIQAAQQASKIRIGAQDCHAKPSGAHTGDVSAAMLADLNVRDVILGHSERRADHGETDALVAAKTTAAWAADLNVILCIGESAAEREAGQTLDVIARQLAGSIPSGASPDRLVIAYEPIWAIGTGAVATTEQIAEVHGAIRGQIDAEIALLYGGSVKPGNAAEIFALADVDGALVGGASLKATDFGPIITALQDSMA